MTVGWISVLGLRKLRVSLNLCNRHTSRGKLTKSTVLH